MNIANLPFNWFDIVVLILLMIGIRSGRKHGMSQEVMFMLTWVSLVLLCGIAYEPLGLWLASTVGMGKLLAYVLAYALTAAFVVLVFAFLNRVIGEKLKGSDTFGKAEYYLAMPAGMVRFACITLMLLALLNARLYQTYEIKAMTKFQDENYGSQFFPTLQSVQSGVLEKSFVGSQTKKHLGFLLIKPTPPSAPGAASQQVKRREFTLP
jgi:Colicin V production protein